MTAKRRKLSVGDEVVLIYDVKTGFIKQSAVFKEYRTIQYNEVTHDIPVFQRLNSEITGLECFWVPAAGANDIIIERTQRELIDLQIKVLEIAEIEGIKIPEKIKDSEIRTMVENSSNFRQALKEKLGYDPMDYSWIEKELSNNDLEKDWFQFQRENDTKFNDQWHKISSEFNQKFKADILPIEALRLAKKWKRYLIGSWNTIRAQNLDIESWKTAARKFEKFHMDRDERMSKWSDSHENNFPLAKVKEPVDFFPGPYFNNCIEKTPKIFVNPSCSLLQPGVVLKVVSYDPQDKYISLDFTDDIRKLINPNTPPNKIGEELNADYIISVMPDDIDSKLELLGSLD